MKDLVEPDESNHPSPQSSVLITIPEEYVGACLQELEFQDGLINGMDAHQQTVSIQASLPLSKCTALASAIEELTEGRGRVDLADS